MKLYFIYNIIYPYTIKKKKKKIDLGGSLKCENCWKVGHTLITNYWVSDV